MIKNEVVVIGWDIDDTITNGTAWDYEQILSAEPRQDILDLMNLAHHRFYNVVHTARRKELYIPTLAWLAKVDAGYQAIHMGKMASDLYVDDRSLNPDCPTCLDKLNKIIKG